MANVRANRVVLVLLCPHCGQGVQTRLSWLITVSRFPCRCGGEIDLQRGSEAMLIRKLADACARVDALATRVDALARKGIKGRDSRSMVRVRSNFAEAVVSPLD